MPLNPWITRAIIGAVGSVVTTTIIVTTAKDPEKKKKRKKKRKKGKDGVMVQENVPRSMGAQAAHDYRSGPDEGLTGAEFIDGLRDSGKKLQRGLAYLGGGLFGTNRRAPSGVEGETAEDAPPKKRRRRRRRPPGKGRPPPGKRRRRRPPAKQKSDFEAIRDHAAKAVRDKAVESATEKLGATELVENIKDGAETLKTQAGQWGEAIKDAVPEDLGDRASEVGRGILDFGSKVGDSIKSAFDDEYDWSSAKGAQKAVDTLSDRVDEQLKSLAESVGEAEVAQEDAPVEDAPVEDAPEIVDAEFVVVEKEK